ncbi:MAG: hypothetical protein M1817_003621 [Caeruleum heppii]|nr:MAG: hypothetical protein M1817_003621 [Caeruleum heppii]
MSITTPLPPLHHHRNRLVSPATALAQIQTYLSSCQTSAHLHPDALLTDQGPQFLSAGSKGGLVLHNLRRVEAGLRGEWMAAVEDEAEEEEEEGEELKNGVVEAGQRGEKEGDGGRGGASQKSTTKSSLPTPSQHPHDASSSAAAPVLPSEPAEIIPNDWQDPQTYALQQEISEGELGQRVTTTVDHADLPKIRADKAATVDKERRRREKKKRLKVEKMRREEKRRQEKAAEGEGRMDVDDGSE